jgi:chromosome segregation protein
MKLSRLELSGFKSFADTVTLSFEDGVTAIVGPNGCGKSNVSDAVRWVLGEQSARLLRGGKMEDVIFQGSANRRPVNLTEVSLYLDNQDGALPIAYQEVVITRRLSRSGQSDYLLNSTPVRLRDIQDLLRGTGMGSDAGVVIEARMVDLLLSDRADERRSLFEEAAGIGLYRDRKLATERRLDETATDLQRLEDLLTEVQSQIRSLARQKGKAERHAKLTEEKFLVQVTLARRMLDNLAAQAAGLDARHQELAEQLPRARRELADTAAEQERRSRDRAAAEAHRASIAKDLSDARVAVARLEADLAVAGERRGHTSSRRQRAEEERGQMELRTEQARLEAEQAAGERADAEREYHRIQAELSGRLAAEEEVRQRLATRREAVRRQEQELQHRMQSLRSLEGERLALESELASLRESAEVAQAHREALQVELTEQESRAREAEDVSEARRRSAREAASEAERLRHLAAGTREREAAERTECRQAEESLAQVTARRHALEELERDRVGLAPAAAALLAARERFDGAVLGPLSDFVSTGREEAELAERLLGEWIHAVLVRDWRALDQIRAWHAREQPGALVLLPVEPGPSSQSLAPHPLSGRLRTEGPAAAWVDALVAGSEVLEPNGRVLRRASGAVYLGGAVGSSGPLRRRADLADLSGEAGRLEHRLVEANQQLVTTRVRLAELESETAAASETATRGLEAERLAVAARNDAQRVLANLRRELHGAEAQLARVRDRMDQASRRRAEVDAAFTEGERTRLRLEESLASGRVQQTTMEADQEGARESRLHWQVQEAHLGARLRSATERMDRVASIMGEARSAADTLTAEIAGLDANGQDLAAQQGRWEEARGEGRTTVAALELAASETEAALGAADARLLAAERAVADLRASVDLLTEEHHRLEIELTEVGATRRSIRDRVETEWHAPLEQLLRGVQLLDLDLHTLEAEGGRIVEALEGIGPVNALAVEEHAEEVKRLEFLTGQRDDLVAARQSLLQAIREIDGTARGMFSEAFAAIQSNFGAVFQTLFGGGECALRLATPDDPLESEIEIHAAPRGKRIQRIHLLSGGERTLVATSLLFAIYLTKPSPFCLMDEVDAPLDDANVGRFTNLLHEFKHSTQFVVITHNPRTMQAADAVYGVTMQEPGVSTLVGVRLGEHLGTTPVAAPA